MKYIILYFCFFFALSLSEAKDSSVQNTCENIGSVKNSDKLFFNDPATQYSLKNWTKKNGDAYVVSEEAVNATKQNFCKHLNISPCDITIGALGRDEGKVEFVRVENKQSGITAFFHLPTGRGISLPRQADVNMSRFGFVRNNDEHILYFMTIINGDIKTCLAKGNGVELMNTRNTQRSPFPQATSYELFGSDGVKKYEIHGDHVVIRGNSGETRFRPLEHEPNLPNSLPASGSQ